MVPLETATASSTPSQSAKARSKRSPIGPSESRPGAQHLEHQLLLARPDLGPRERDRFGVRQRSMRGGPYSRVAVRGWKAYSSESTSASQEASMMFSETPIVPHSRSPSEESSRTRVTALGAVGLVEDPHLVVGQLDLGEVRVAVGDRRAQGAVEGVDRAVALGDLDVALAVDHDLDRRLGLAPGRPSRFSVVTRKLSSSNSGS